MIINTSLRRTLALFAFLLTTCYVAPSVKAQSTSDLRASGHIQFEKSGVSSIALTGTESLLSRFNCHGELHFSPNSSPKGVLNGTGIVIFHAANGDQLVGTVGLISDAKGDGQVFFTWRHSVQLSNGSVVNSTGRFRQQLPANSKSKVKTKPGIVVIAIIAVLIG